ncbi:hypothetical protein [Candidatus Palauibacter sp.]|uniref:hypothetical protein n=1 Tax=Candidatus Palauibacter sp. TaxID=3101350 RepID=UPI003B02E8D4
MRVRQCDSVSYDIVHEGERAAPRCVLCVGEEFGRREQPREHPEFLVRQNLRKVARNQSDQVPSLGIVPQVDLIAAAACLAIPSFRSFIGLILALYLAEDTLDLAKEVSELAPFIGYAAAVYQEHFRIAARSTPASSLALKFRPVRTGF